MKKTILMTFTVFGIMILSGCQPDAELADVKPALSSERMGVQDNFSAHLTSKQEVRTPPVVSIAQGQTNLMFSADGLSVTYMINVSQLENVVGAHLHLAPVGVNGPVVVGLLSGPVNGKVNGKLVAGTFTAADLVGPMAGQTLEDLRTEILDGNIYVNVHTTAYPGGEIRGQVK